MSARLDMPRNLARLDLAVRRERRFGGRDRGRSDRAWSEARPPGVAAVDEKESRAQACTTSAVGRRTPSRGFDLLPTRADGQPAFVPVSAVAPASPHGTGLVRLTLAGDRLCAMTRIENQRADDSAPALAPTPDSPVVSAHSGRSVRYRGNHQCGSSGGPVR